MVVYIITATPLGPRTMKQVQCKREVYVMPRVLAEPPLQIENFPGEYTTTSERTLKRHFWTHSLGKLHIMSLEPPPLNMSTNAPRAATKATIRLTFHPDIAPQASLSPLEWTVIVKQRLMTRTFYPTRPYKSAPTKLSTKNNSEACMSNSLTAPETRKYSALCWRRRRIYSTSIIRSNTSEDEDAPAPVPWTTTVTVPVSASKELLPDFLSPLGARWYALQLQISVAGLAQSTLLLELPAQVINTRCREKSPSFSDSDCGEPVAEETSVIGEASSEFPPLYTMTS